MGSTVEACCGEPSQARKLISKKSIVEKRKNEGGKSSDEIQTKDEKILWQQKNGQLTLSDQYILRLLGKLIKIDKQTIIEDFQIEGILGVGSFGVVYLAQLKSNIAKGITQKYAIKRVAKELLVKKNLITNAMDQRDILAMCNRFLVHLIMAFQDPWYLYLVMEYAIGGDTYSLFQQGSFKFSCYKNLGEASVKFIAGCVILALECLHDNNYMYRDLKPENVLIFQDGYVKLTDFGLVKKSVEGQKSQTISGTQFYYAPQMVLTKGYGKQIDFWALGIYLYEISNYQPPFTQEQINKAHFQEACLQAQKNRVWLNNNLSPQLKDLIDKLLQFNPNDRLGVKGRWTDVKNHPFFKDFNWNELQQGKMPSPLEKIVNLFSPSVKPFKPQPRQTQAQQKKVEGWSLVKKYTL